MRTRTHAAPARPTALALPALLALLALASPTTGCTTDEGESATDSCPGSCQEMAGVYEMTGSCPPKRCTALQDDCSVQISCDDGTSGSGRIEAGRVEFERYDGVLCGASVGPDGLSGTCTGEDFACAFDGRRALVRACLGAADANTTEPVAVADCTETELSEAVPGCDCLRATRAGRTYLFCPQGATWADARTMCRARGGDLAVLSDGDEAAWLARVAETAGVYGAWIGATDAGFEGTWTWVDESPFVGLPWGDGEPNNDLGSSPDGEDCAQFADAATLNDQRCDASQSIVCEGSGTLER